MIRRSTGSAEGESAFDDGSALWGKLITIPQINIGGPGLMVGLLLSRYFGFLKGFRRGLRFILERVTGRHFEERAGGLAAVDVHQTVNRIATARIAALSHDESLQPG